MLNIFPKMKVYWQVASKSNFQSRIRRKSLKEQKGLGNCLLKLLFGQIWSS